MGRPPRILPSDMDYHVIVRCNNGEFLLKEEEDFLRYLWVLRRIRKKHGFQVFNYELMNSHVHLFLRPSLDVALCKSMMEINCGFARDYNRRKKRKGHVWMQRYRAIPVESEEYSLALMRYINRNPVRAGMVEQVGDWRWSGFHAYATENVDSLITRHLAYEGLSRDELTRKREYKRLVNLTLPGDGLKNPIYTDAAAIGSERFIQLFIPEFPQQDL